MEEENNVPGAFVSITADTKEQLEEILSETIDALICNHAMVQRELVQQRKEAAFARYLRTGRFD